MEYMGNMDYWDKKFADKGSIPLSPEKALIQNIGCFKNGTVLDLASGDGRNALFLSKNGFQVTAVDFSAKALERLKLFAGQDDNSITMKQIDLNLPNALKNVGAFDNIVINHYRLGKTQLAELKDHVSAGGILFVCGFGHKHTPDSKIRKEDLIQPADFEETEKAWKLIQYLEEWEERGFFVTYIFRNNSVEQ